MTATSIHHRPAHLLAAAAAVAVLAVGSLGVALSQQADHPGTPPIQQVSQTHHHLQPTTSGGRVMVGQ